MISFIRGKGGLLRGLGRFSRTVQCSLGATALQTPVEPGVSISQDSCCLPFTVVTAEHIVCGILRGVCVQTLV